MNTTNHPFEVAMAPYLVAVGNHRRLRVYRSVDEVDTSAPAYQRITDHVREHGLVLMSRLTGPYDGMFGDTEQSHYVKPQVRLLVTERAGSVNPK